MQNTIPNIASKPTVITQPILLKWPSDLDNSLSDISEATANRLNDIHGTINQCDLLLSSSGNYHMAFKNIWDMFLHKKAIPMNFKNCLYTTTPPIIEKQLLNGGFNIGNLSIQTKPQVAIIPGKLSEVLQQQNLIEDDPLPLIQNKGNVLLVSKNNPKKISSIWDLAKNNVRIATPNPDSEPGTFNNFSHSIFNIANQISDKKSDSADNLFNEIFSSNNKTKWICGEKIMHREIPWLIASNFADVAVVFYHLAKHICELFPNQFSIIPLGGSVDKPNPLPGNRIGVLHLVKIKSLWTEKQIQARNAMIEILTSDECTHLLHNCGLERPKSFTETQLEKADLAFS